MTGTGTDDASGGGGGGGERGNIIQGCVGGEIHQRRRDAGAGNTTQHRTAQQSRAGHGTLSLQPPSPVPLPPRSRNPLLGIINSPG